MIAYGEDYAVSASRQGMGISGRMFCLSTLFDCSPDPTLVVLSALWHRLRIWDGIFEILAARLYSFQSVLTESTLVSCYSPHFQRSADWNGMCAS